MAVLIKPLLLCVRLGALLDLQAKEAMYHGVRNHLELGPQRLRFAFHKGEPWDWLEVSEFPILSK